MRILCITDKLRCEYETALKGIFEKHILKYCEVYMVYFTKDSKEATSDGKYITLPYYTKHRKFVKSLLKTHYNLNDFDFIIVRNFYSIARQILPFYKNIIFWETFPHDYRRIYEAKRDNKSILRKSIEYKIKHYLNTKILEKCIAYVGSTPHFKTNFYPNLQIKTSYIPNGIDFDMCNLKLINQNINKINSPIKILYIGTIDKNRQMINIIQAINKVDREFIFDIFTSSNNEETEKIIQISTKNHRIKLHKPKPFNEIFETIALYDIGIGIIPNTPLYSVSSPIKAMEYAGNGVIPIINDLPEYKRIFNEQNSFVCSLNENDIINAITNIIDLNENELISKKQNVFKLAQNTLDYKKISKEIYDFIKTLQ